LFTEIFPASDITVSLPNGTTFPILHTGTIQLTDTLRLLNVLHVPSFHFNLVSVHSLLVQNNCSAHFFPAYCYLQDVSQGLMIGKGDVVNNLYILNKHAVCESSPSDVFCGSLSVDGSTWHQRLGHPSATKLKMLSGTLCLSPSSFTSIDQCHVCPFS